MHDETYKTNLFQNTCILIDCIWQGDIPLGSAGAQKICLLIHLRVSHIIKFLPFGIWGEGKIQELLEQSMQARSANQTHNLKKK